jgi:hypothetical protein
MQKRRNKAKFQCGAAALLFSSTILSCPALATPKLTTLYLFLAANNDANGGEPDAAGTVYRFDPSSDTVTILIRP